MKNSEIKSEIISDQKSIAIMIKIRKIYLIHLQGKLNNLEKLPLEKTLEFYNMIIFVRSVFREDNKQNPGDVLAKCLKFDTGTFFR